MPFPFFHVRVPSASPSPSPSRSGSPTSYVTATSTTSQLNAAHKPSTKPTNTPDQHPDTPPSQGTPSDEHDWLTTTSSSPSSSPHPPTPKTHPSAHPPYTRHPSPPTPSRLGQKHPLPRGRSRTPRVPATAALPFLPPLPASPASPRLRLRLGRTPTPTPASVSGSSSLSGSYGPSVSSGPYVSSGSGGQNQGSSPAAGVSASSSDGPGSGSGSECDASTGGSGASAASSRESSGSSGSFITSIQVQPAPVAGSRVPERDFRNGFGSPVEQSAVPGRSGPLVAGPAVLGLEGTRASAGVVYRHVGTQSGEAGGCNGHLGCKPGVVADCSDGDAREYVHARGQGCGHAHIFRPLVFALEGPCDSVESLLSLGQYHNAGSCRGGLSSHDALEERVLSGGGSVRLCYGCRRGTGVIERARSAPAISHGGVVNGKKVVGRLEGDETGGGGVGGGGNGTWLKLT